MNLSDKQLETLIDSDARMNIWVGSVRSGKTFASIYRLIDFLKNGAPGDVMIIGVNRESIQRNIVTQLYQMLDAPIPAPKTNFTKLYNRNVYLIGANDEGSVRRIQGATLACAYVDEIACLPKSFIRMLQSRLSVPGAQLFATCNPEGPAHWLKKEFLDNPELQLKSWHFTLDDNPALDEAYKNSLKKEYTGMWYKRYILGQWAASSGVVYDGFDDDNIYEDEPLNANYYVAGMDYGTVDATACYIAAINPKEYPQIRIQKEYYYDARKEGRSKTDAELADDIEQFIRGYNLRTFYVDPSAASIKQELRNRNLPVQDAKNDVLAGIQVVAKWIHGKNIIIHKSCQNLIESMYSYAWDEKAANRGLDKPLHDYSHSVDATRYTIFSEFPNGEFNNPLNNMSHEELLNRVYGSDDVYEISL